MKGSKLSPMTDRESVIPAGSSGELHDLIEFEEASRDDLQLLVVAQLLPQLDQCHVHDLNTVPIHLFQYSFHAIELFKCLL